MRKLYRLLSIVVMLLMSLNLLAQEKTVSGTVLSEDGGTPLVGVTVTNSQTNRKTTTNASGAFSIPAASGQSLVFSSVGFETQRVTVGAGNSINISLKSTSGQLEDVVVTAMDIKRNPRELGYSVQAVKGSEIAETQRENFINGLQGRIAGATITTSSGIAGASSSIVLRGFNSLSLSNQPLFVVDGIIVDNQTIDENSGGGSGVGLASDRPNRNNDYTNRVADINPNDIESITVLKGPEATALYGSQASSGAIVITTKKGRANGRLNVNYDNSFRFQELTRYAELNNDYTTGRNGVFQRSISSASASFFGPKYPEGTLKFNNIDNFFETGLAQNHNLSMDFGNSISTFRISGSYFDQSGIVPNNQFKRINLRLSNTTKIGKFIEVSPAISYINSHNDKPLRGEGGYLLSLYAWPVDDDISDFLDDNGNKKALFASDPSQEMDNPLFNVFANRSRDRTNRYIASLSVNANPTSWLSLAGRFGYDTYGAEGSTFYHPKSIQAGANSARGILDNYWRNYYGYNHTINATANKTFGKFKARLMVGTMWQDYETQMFSITGRNLLDSTKYNTDSNNTSVNTRVRLLRNNFGEPNRSITRQSAVFGETALSYKNLLFLTYSHRFESASVFPSKNRNYNYPGISLSAILSDVFPKVKGDFLDYWKLRTSTANTARLNSPYSNQSVFVNNFASGGGFSYGFTNSNPDLGPERQSTYEVGTELKVLKSRISLDLTYYNTTIKDQIAEGYRASYATGFVLNTQNAASTRNQGLEIVLDANPVKRPTFNWNIRFNFNKMYNKVLDIPKVLSEYYIADTWVYGNARGGLVRGGATTTITGFGYERNTNGDILISPTTGLPVVDQTFRVRGDRNPDFTLGTLNNIRYKNFSLSMLWDMKIGGDVFNGTERYLTIQGKGRRTADRETPRIVTGVLRDGLQNSATPTPNNIVVTPYYQDAYYIQMPEEEFIEKDVNYLRLRDVSMNYTFSKGTLTRVKAIKSLAVFVTANDLVLITNYVGADPAGNANTAGSRGVGGFGFDYGNLPSPVSINFGIRASF
jgi:TonB-linked SusC/RagA family outer membrane protein